MDAEGLRVHGLYSYIRACVVRREHVARARSTKEFSGNNINVSVFLVTLTLRYRAYLYSFILILFFFSQAILAVFHK